MNFATRPAERNFCFRYSALTAITLSLSRITPLRMWSHYDILSMDLSVELCAINSLFFLLYSNSRFACVQLASKTVILKRVVRRVLSSFAMTTYFIMVNVFHFDFILCDISVSISQHIFTIRPKSTYSFTSSISSIPTNIQPSGTSLECMNLVFMRFILKLMIELRLSSMVSIVCNGLLVSAVSTISSANRR